MSRAHTCQSPTIEDLEFGLQSSLALVGSAADDLRIAGRAATNSITTRRDQLLALRYAANAANEMARRLPLLLNEVLAIVRHLDPSSELLES